MKMMAGEIHGRQSMTEVEYPLRTVDVNVMAREGNTCQNHS
jgi:hypothetical protein